MVNVPRTRRSPKARVSAAPQHLGHANEPVRAMAGAMARRVMPSAARITPASMPCPSEVWTIWAMVDTPEVIGLPSPEKVPRSSSSAVSSKSGGRIAPMPLAKGANSRALIPSARATARACA